MNKQSYSVSVIICTYKRQKWLEGLLTSISEQTVQPKELIIVDATPTEIDYSIPKGLEIFFIRSNKMQLTYQRNLGVKVASGDIILHLDDDTYIEQDFIYQMLEVFQNDTEKKIGALSGYVTNQWGLRAYKPSFVMGLMKWLGLDKGDFSPGSLSHSGVFIGLNNLIPFTGIQFTDFISGCSFAVRSDVYCKYKHPEMINRYGGEDKVFSRMIANDWKMCVCGDAKTQHFSAPGGARQTDFSETKSTVLFHLFIQRNYGGVNRSTLRLRLNYILNSMRMYIISILMFLSFTKIKKSFKWFRRASGYLVGAFCSVGLEHD
jgi:glycosyltransferase involved in cell wall biosynthesis